MGWIRVERKKGLDRTIHSIYQALLGGSSSLLESINVQRRQALITFECGSTLLPTFFRKIPSSSHCPTVTPKAEGNFKDPKNATKRRPNIQP